MELRVERVEKSKPTGVFGAYLAARILALLVLSFGQSAAGWQSNKAPPGPGSDSPMKVNNSHQKLTKIYGKFILMVKLHSIFI